MRASLSPDALAAGGVTSGQVASVVAAAEGANLATVTSAWNNAVAD
jgi:hypothetical protein